MNYGRVHLGRIAMSVLIRHVYGLADAERRLGSTLSGRPTANRFARLKFQGAACAQSQAGANFYSTLSGAIISLAGLGQSWDQLKNSKQEEPKKDQYEQIPYSHYQYRGIYYILPGFAGRKVTRPTPKGPFGQ